MHAALKWTLKAAVIPAAVVGYVSIAGLTGFCPSCKSVVDAVLGRHAPMVRPIGAAETIAGVQGYTLDGEGVELASLSGGKPMIIEVWATWCPPCRTQRGIIHKIAGELKEKATLVSLSVDSDPRLVTSFLGTNESDMVELMAPPETRQAFGGIEAVPTLIFVDASGRIRGVESGVHSAGLLRARLAELVAN
jgi:thiol-disulfide isomerase/thioredoxin